MKKKPIIIVLVASAILTLSGWLFWGCRSTDPFRAIEAEREKDMREIRKIWETPITFYGKVVDEKGNPIPGASVSFIITDTSRAGHSEYSRRSDNDGLFSLKGVKGYAIQVGVEKEGHYRGPISLQSFRSVAFDSEIPVPSDPANPAVFILRKKGEAAALIVNRWTIKPVPLDGTPVELDLKTGKSVPAGEGHIKVECWAPDRWTKNVYDWRCKISVPDGGLVKVDRNELFPFEAPEEGYQPSDEINMPAALGQDWQSDALRKYYLKLKDNNYAFLVFDLTMGGRPPFLMLQCNLNPSGSRNLEYDKAKQINK
jgi:hypothetical protein